MTSSHSTSIAFGVALREEAQDAVWKSLNRLVIQLASKKAGLRGLLTYGGIMNYLKQADVIIIMYQDSYPIGFALLQFTVSSSAPSSSNSNETLRWLLSVIVTKRGFGSNLINYILAQARTFDVDSVYLYALPELIPYYRRFGFKNMHLDECEESKDTIESAISIQGLKFRSTLEATNDDRYVSFLQTLIEQGLVSDPTCKDVWECSQDGFLMVWCNSKGRNDDT